MEGITLLLKELERPKRGRPRKLTKKTDSSFHEPPVKRKRGRPRKIDKEYNLVGPSQQTDTELKPKQAAERFLPSSLSSPTTINTLNYSSTKSDTDYPTIHLEMQNAFSKDFIIFKSEQSPSNVQNVKNCHNSNT
jgi:hypothetical protein